MESTESRQPEHRREVPRGLLAKSIGKTMLDRGEAVRPKPIEHSIPQSGPNTEEAVAYAEAKRKNVELKKKISSFERDSEIYEKFLAYYASSKSRLEQTRAHIASELSRQTVWWNLFPNTWHIEHLKEKIASIDQDLSNLEESKDDREEYLRDNYKQFGVDPAEAALTLPSKLFVHRDNKSEKKRQQARRSTS